MASIKLTFQDDFKLGESIKIRYGDDIDIFYDIVEFREKEGELTAPKPIPNLLGSASVRSLASAIQTDFSSRLFKVNIINEFSLELTSTDPEIGFSVIESLNFIVIDLDDPVELFKITNVDFLTGSDCSKIKIEITTNDQADQIITPIQQNVSENPFTIEVPRGVNTIVNVRKDNEYSSESISVPPELTADAINVATWYLPDGSSILIEDEGNLPGLDLEFSLDNENWNDDGRYQSLLDGEYTAYIKDQFGCEVELDFTLGSETQQNPYTYISKANSIRFAKRDDLGDCGDYENQDNTLSCEENVEGTAFKWLTMLQPCDDITIQLRSNYQNISVNAKYLNGNLNDVSIPIVKVQSNIGKRDTRDAMITSIGSNKVGIYFKSGNIYDFDTENAIGDYSLNGSLPEWAVIDNNIRVNNNWYKILDIVYSEGKNAEIAIIQQGLVQLYLNDEPVIVSSIYNRENYDVYEFTLNSNLINLNSRFQIEIKHQDPLFDEVVWISEECEVKNRWLNSCYLEYWNKYNTDIIYATGIKHKVRLMIESVESGVNDSPENLKSDSDVRFINDKVYETQKYSLFCTTGILRQLSIAFSVSEISINGIRLVKEEIDIEWQDKTNIYLLSPTMIIRSEAQPKKDALPNLNIEVPNLISNGSGFVKYD